MSLSTSLSTKTVDKFCSISASFEVKLVLADVSGLTSVLGAGVGQACSQVSRMLRFGKFTRSSQTYFYITLK
jgi:hypothetical protein